MTPQQRVHAACEFRRPDRIPRFDSFWEYTGAWRERFGPEEGLADLAVWVPDEGTFPTGAGVVKEEGGWVYSRNSWGQLVRTRAGAFFYETLECPLRPGVDIDKVSFDPPDLDMRFFQRRSSIAEANAALTEAKEKQLVFGKTGGPYLRSTFVRGEADFLMDIAGDEPMARAIADKVADHLIGVGVEEIRRWDLRESGIWIYDDMAYNAGPMFSPRAFERIFLDAYRRMVRAYKTAGARYVFLHSDGNIRPLLEMLVDAGIDGLNPIEPRAGMDIAEIRRSFPRLILVGGMDNSDTLVNGPAVRIQAEARRIIDLGRDGGVIIGAHSIGPDISLNHFQAYHETCLDYGDFTA
ncbi:MAG: uroporphyrinogen decarboxylase family protein [Phycisphaerae bacterium]